MSALLARIVAASCRRPWTVLLVLALLCIGALLFTRSHFAMTTDTAQLISAKAAWRQRQTAIDKAFPQGVDQVVVVIDGKTPELAESAAAVLADKLSMRTDLAYSVRRPDGGPFFARNGLLFLSRQQVADTTSQLITAQPVLGPLAADPSLRGVANGLSTLMQGVSSGQTSLDALNPMLTGLADAVERTDKGQRVFFSWEALLASQGHGAPAPKRRIILVQSKLDYSALEPGSKVEDAIRQTAKALHLDAAHGVTVRLTGDVPLSDEEFSSLADRAWLVSSAMLGAVFLMLWLATRSMRMVACILITTAAGLLLTMGAGLAAVGRFNLISVAFIPLFVGLGIDFGIQLMVRFRAERQEESGILVPEALVRSANRIGGSLAVAAGAITLGFFAFLPTSYVGVSELGVISGIGMIIALLLNLTLLPALVMLLHPPEQDLAVGYAWFEPVDRYLHERRSVVLAAFGVAVLVSIALLPFVRFDFNPLHLRNPLGEAMATLTDLMHDPQDTPNTIDILRPSLAAADHTVDQLSRLPEVDQAITLSSFVPDDQPAKLALIQDASLLLDTAVNPISTQPAPTDAETIQSLTTAAAALRSGAGSATSPAAANARRLAAALDGLAKAPAAYRTNAQDALTQPLSALLDQIRNMLAAAPITLQSLPPDLVRDWVSASGKARVQVLPRGDSNNNNVLVRFAKAVRSVAPDASGGPISIQEAAKTIQNAFIEAGILSLIAVAGLLFVKLRSVKEVAFTLAPVVLSGFLTLGTCVLINQPINFANIIAFPLLFGVGVAFHIYFVLAWRAGETNLLQSSLTRAVLFSALTTGVAFGSLWLSSHPGTASMGKILMISIVWTLVCALLFEPALLGPPPKELKR
jgi:hopanoid biosynthesis associated RND transporter like protein HpnN